MVPLSTACGAGYYAADTTMIHNTNGLFVTSGATGWYIISIVFIRITYFKLVFCLIIV